MWDEIAFNELGSELFVTELLAANLDYIDVVIFDSGITLEVPVVVVEGNEGINDTLPPWRTQ